MKYKKSLYFDGHDRPDILDCQQNHFLPAMQEYRSRLVEYTVGDVERDIIKQLKPGK